MTEKRNRVLKGMEAAPGFAAGPVFLWRESDLTLPAPYPCRDPEEAWQKVQSAIGRARAELDQLRDRVEAAAGSGEAAIFEAQLMMLDDIALHEAVKSALAEGTNPEAAWHGAVEKFAAELESLPDRTLSARAVDVRDIGGRVLAHLLGRPTIENTVLAPSVVVARDLTPSQTATMDHALVLAFCTAEGGPTSHTAILAKALGIPAIVALGESVLGLSPGDEVIVDAGAGELTVHPTDDQKADLARRRSGAEARRADDLRAAIRPAVSRDGVRVDVFANIGGVADARAALEYGAEGIGLFRTEFLYLQQRSPPTAAQQIDVYRQVIQILAGRPLVVRTLDIGGDKRADYLDMRHEPNPFLGWRGIRIVADHPEILRDQFYAILMAAQGTDIRIMVPMVSRVDEAVRARELMDEALAAVRRESSGYAAHLQFGIMVEVPAAALMIEHFAPHVDFFSIGTNDLTQYTVAVDRTNARVASLASPFHPAVLKLMARTTRVAHEHGRWVGLCGEFAGDPLATPFLLGIDLDEFSMPAAAIPAVKSIIRQLSVEECRPMAEHVLGLATAEEARAYLQSELQRLAR